MFAVFIDMGRGSENSPLKQKLYTRQPRNTAGCDDFAKIIMSSLLKLLQIFRAAALCEISH